MIMMLGVSFVMTFLEPGVGNTAFVFLEIFFARYFNIKVADLMTSSLFWFACYSDVNISKTKKHIPKRKMPFLVVLNVFQMNSNNFSFYRHFKK